MNRISVGKRAPTGVRASLSFSAFAQTSGKNDPRSHTKFHEEISVAWCDLVDRFLPLSQDTRKLNQLVRSGVLVDYSGTRQ